MDTEPQALDIKAKLERIRNLLLKPSAEWEKIAADTEECEALLCDRQIETERPEAELGNQQKLDWVA